MTTPARLPRPRPRCCKDFVVPEAQNAPALALEPCGAAAIVVIVGVLTAIGFDNQTMLRTGEIDDEIADRVLSAEAVTAQPAVA
jgi:hypothetical protein